eukprot:scaffold86767_cov33-Tisochrysis_lutea.AAC.3
MEVGLAPPPTLSTPLMGGENHPPPPARVASWHGHGTHPNSPRELAGQQIARRWLAHAGLLIALTNLCPHMDALDQEPPATS